MPCNSLISNNFVVFFNFFYISHKDHSALHSFPTRRSSDLGKCPGGRASLTSHGIPAAPSSISSRSIRSPTRSEEHTSELQSLAYLVCRLLLEKKNRP